MYADRKAPVAGPQDYDGTMQYRSPWIPLLLVDALLVMLFAAIGHREHERSLGVLGILETAAPFLLALAVLALATRFRATHSRIWPHGVVLWLGTVALGLALRILTGSTAAVPFVVVATIALGVLLLGRRAVTQFAASRKVRAGGP